MKVSTVSLSGNLRRRDTKYIHLY